MGIAAMSVKVAIAGDTARVVAPTGTPTFYFFDASNPATATLLQAGPGERLNGLLTDEFTLIRLMERAADARLA